MLTDPPGLDSQTDPSTNTVRPSGFFALRTPLLPLDDFLAWSEGLVAASAQNAPAVAEALVSDTRKLRERLRRVVGLPEVREAIFVASPDLSESLSLWEKEPESERGQKVERTLVRYFSRMTGRATPFGLFAGCSVGLLGERTELHLVGREKYQRHTRLDMEYVTKLTDELGRDEMLRDVLVYRPNSSLYRAGGRLRYAEGRNSDSGRAYHLVAFDMDANVDAALEKAARGALLSDLASRLLELNPGATQANANAFVRQMVKRQMLVPELDPAVTGIDPLLPLSEQLGAHPSFENASYRLRQTAKLLEELDAGGLGNPADHYRAIATLLGDLPTPIHLPRLFQVDMVKPSPDATLGKAVVQEIQRGIHILKRIGGRSADESLKAFRQAFENRYEQREVPLVEVLDEEMGIGFALQPGEMGASPLLQGIDFPAVPSPNASFGTRDQFLLGKLEDVWRHGKHSWDLQAEDLKALEVPSPSELPDAFCVMATLAASPRETDADFQIHLSFAGGPSGATYLGRFCRSDPALHEHVTRHLREEQAARHDACFAEIVHLPEGRIGNIISRPVLREYEIPYLGRSGTDDDKQIPVTDLQVSVVQGRIVLRSTKLGCEVIPRLTNAHNFAAVKNTTLYRFLCSLQSQESTGADWRWGPLNSAPFLPRVTVGRLVLSLAHWNLGEKQLKALGENSAADRFVAVQKLRQSIRLPRFVSLSEGDNVLRMDLDNALSVETFVHLVKGQPSAILVEDFPGSDQLCATGPEGHFVHELIMPFVRDSRSSPKINSRKVPAAPKPITRSFPPGSPWLFAKLYTGNSTADRVLLALHPLLAEAQSSQLMERWFFIRYGDPDWHIRLRLYGDPQKLLGQFLPMLHQSMTPLYEDGRLRRLQLDTYEREVERYGGPAGIELAEQLFCVDSEAVLSLLESVSEDGGADARWRLALRGMDTLLNDLGFELSQKLPIVRQMRDGFGKEFAIDNRLKHQMGERFRKERKNLEQLLWDGGGSNALAPAFAIMRERSEKMAPIAREFKGQAMAGALNTSLEGIAGSLLHMHANRLLRSTHRRQELILYEFLVRLYESKMARNRSGRPIASSIQVPG